MGTIADTIRAALSAGKTNEEVLAEVKAAHPGSNTSPACVSYYRSKMKKAGTAVPKAPKPKPIAKAVEVAVGHGYSVKGVKTFRGNEGYGFNATLYKDGKAIAFVYDDANGGCYSYEWKDTSAIAALEALAKEKHPDLKFEQMDAFVNDLVEDVLLERDAAKLVKGKVAILKDGKLYSVKPKSGIVTPEFIALVRQKNAGAKVLNGLDTAAIVAILKGMQ